MEEIEYLMVATLNYSVCSSQNCFQADAKTFIYLINEIFFFSCLSLSFSICLWKVKVIVTQSCPTLCNPMNCKNHEILQARILALNSPNQRVGKRRKSVDLLWYESTKGYLICFFTGTFLIMFCNWESENLPWEKLLLKGLMS